MRKLDQYLSTIDTMYPDEYAREHYFRDSGDMLDPQPLVYAHNGSLFSRMVAAVRGWHAKRRGRAVLRELTDFELDDIGVTPFEACREVRKSRFFD